MKPLAPRDALALVLGPAWSQNTPHTAEEASVILGATEPRHALRDRMHHRMQRTLGNVVLEPSPRVTPGEPMPEATMPRAQWRATWRDAEVPVLCALRERCEATGARVVLPLDGLELPESVYYRYRLDGDGPLSGVLWAMRAGADVTVDELCRVDTPRGGGAHVPADAEGESAENWSRENARRLMPPNIPRGWCRGIFPSITEGAAVDPDTAAATWQAMREACPERVYPEPTGESE